MFYSEETEFDYAGHPNPKGLEFEYFDSNCLPDESLTFDFSPCHSVPNLLSPSAFVHPLDIDSKTFELNEVCDFTLNDFVNEEDGGISSGEDASIPSTLLGNGFSNSNQPSPAPWLVTEYSPEDFASSIASVDIVQETRSKFLEQPPLMPLPFKSSPLHSRQPNGVISGRVKKKEYVPSVIHIKKSPTSSPVINVNQTSMTNTAFTAQRTHPSLPLHTIPILQRPRPSPYQSLSNVTVSQPHHSVLENLTKPTEESETKDFLTAPSTIMKNYYSDGFSSADEEDSRSPPNYAMLTANVEASLRNGCRENNGTILLHSMNGSGGTLQSSTTPMITEEEMRVMASEGYPIPNLTFPLSKADEKILKKVRRKIKNKLSAQESRKKKKEYLEKLEKQADSLNQENISLKRRLEDVERRLEMVEVRNRQLMCRLSKVTNSDCSIDQNLSTTIARPMNGHVARPSTLVSPTARCGSTNSNPNSTKFYIMAFVFFFSVLFAGDPSLMAIRPGAPPSIFPFPTTLLVSHGHSSRGMARALLSYYPNLYRSRYFSGVFCPAGVNNCHHPLNKWDRLNRPSSRNKKSRNNASMTQGPIQVALDEKSQVKWMKRFHRAINEDTSPLIQHLIKTPSILLDSTQDSGESAVSECSLTHFWKLLWKCEEEPKSNNLFLPFVQESRYIYYNYRNLSSSRDSTHYNVTNTFKYLTIPSLLLSPIK